MGFESEHAGADTEFTRPGFHLVEQRAMAAMHAVEIADRHGPAAVRARPAGQKTVRDDHGVRLKS
jgi:hypothetical protein